jgi:hypothetical protein
MKGKKEVERKKEEEEGSRWKNEEKEKSRNEE